MFQFFVQLLNVIQMSAGFPSLSGISIKRYPFAQHVPSLQIMDFLHCVRKTNFQFHKNIKLKLTSSKSFATIEHYPGDILTPLNAYNRKLPIVCPVSQAHKLRSSLLSSRLN